MLAELEEVIFRVYPGRVLENPLDQSRGVAWEYDRDRRALHAALRAIARIDPCPRPGLGGAFDISEDNLILDGALRVQISYLGPFATVAPKGEHRSETLAEDLRDSCARVTSALEIAGLRVLEDEELTERVPWMRPKGRSQIPVTVQDCLFGPPAWSVEDED